MHKMKWMMISVALAVVCGLTACGGKEAQPAEPGPPQATALLSVKLARTENETLLLCSGEAGQLYTLPLAGLPVYDETGRAADATALRAGQQLEIGYSGAVQEIYPMQPQDAVYVQIVEQQDDLVGFYYAVLDELYQSDSALNDGIIYLAGDFSAADNLSAGEREALLYLLAGAYQLEALSGSYEELARQGYIDGEQLFFPEGVLLRIEVTESGADSFTFSVSKWRGGDGAVGISNCRARRGADGSWTYQPGEAWIS